MYNNKGGVGKTTLGFNISTQLAEKNHDTQVLVIDMCPQANISQYLLGGGKKGYKRNQSLQSISSRKNVVGFLDWIMDGNSNFTSIRRSFKVKVNKYNKEISDNLFLIAGDSFLESLSLALNYAVLNPANKFAWKEFMMAIKKLCELEFDEEKYKHMVVFIDCNPSFSIYTQMSLLSSDYLIVPMMADYTSLEGIKGIMTLLYGKYPTAASRTYADKFLTFIDQVERHNLNSELPTLWRFVFNNFTSNNGIANAYDSIKNELSNFSYEQYNKSPDLFSNTKKNITNKDDREENYLSLVKDFHTSGKVSASLGIPIHKLPAKRTYIMPNGEKVRVEKIRYEGARKQVRELVDKF
jgi:cellulose biosynthesis protein BcsQ